MQKKDYIYDEAKDFNMFVEEEEIMLLSPEEIQRNFSNDRKENESNYDYRERMNAIKWFSEELLKGRKSGEEEGWVPAEKVRKMFSPDRIDK